MTSLGACPHCSKPISATAKFCTSCGKKIDTPVSVGGGQNFSKEYEAEKKKNQELQQEVSRLASQLKESQATVSSLEDQLRNASHSQVAVAAPPSPSGPSQSDLKAAEDRARVAEDRAKAAESKVANLEAKVKQLENDLQKAKAAWLEATKAAAAPAPSGGGEDNDERVRELEEALIAVERKYEEAEERARLAEERAAAAGVGGGSDYGGGDIPVPPAPVFEASGGPPPPPPPGPPPPPAPGAPPPPPVAGVSAGPPGGGAGRGALLASINGFNKGKLKKAKTVDKSGPVTTTPKASASGGGGGGGDSIAAMAMAARGKMKTPGGDKTKSGRMMKAQVATGPPSNTAHLLGALKKAPTPAPGSPAPQEPASTPNFTSNLRKAAPVEKTPAPQEPASPNFTAGLKASGGNKTKSGRLVKPQQATGPTPSPDFRSGLRKNN